ncbi:hypothetical protein WA026_010790 [Henosepilachna vigintioctopunctata]|uniref:Uncharacterized protein n=1 Tax=Henosepilachna vigintioctopunctata TaxID=420089 RepID=A0AAW1UP12_9CUCU
MADASSAGRRDRFRGGFRSSCVGRGDRGGCRGRGRGRGRGCGRGEDDEKLWNPVNKIGLLVKDSKLSKMKPIHLFSLSFKEF